MKIYTKFEVLKMFLLNNKNLILEESNLKLSNLVSFATLVSQGKERLFSPWTGGWPARLNRSSFCAFNSLSGETPEIRPPQNPVYCENHLTKHWLITRAFFWVWGKCLCEQVIRGVVLLSARVRRFSVINSCPRTEHQMKTPTQNLTTNSITWHQ